MVEVYFDDFKVTHVKSPVIQSQDYYPFGLSYNEYTRENSIGQEYLYNGKEKQNELGLDWLDYGARMYMPEIGRFFVSDRFSEKYHSLSQYNYVANNPINSTDKNGDFIVSIHYKITEDVLKKYGYSSVASRLAWYSSIYADNPTAGILFLNNLYALSQGLPTVTYAQPAGWKTKKSRTRRSFVARCPT